ncbi:hypothetical protein [Tautonia plasticadhaerens]|uniref:DUF3365 domain-containing protein n=1 Tax=Tautonia plasticadhaerens TaxID=2527974 RepID=A0A518H2G2_9BACT|nr:hypothetical protein [Tautonia plasticadhaerens]QDV35042.1 hypothetical protein ElP_29410 [Tautonia plasticadhaerens]
MTTTRRPTLLAWIGGLLASAALLTTMVARPTSADEGGEGDDPALDRARAEVKMLDALYKTAVVSITERYQRGQPAIMVAKDVFGAMDELGHHSARLVDASQAPLGEQTSPETDFERRAAEAMRRGESYVEEVAGEGPDRRLLAATVVPAVHRRCASCHGVEEGDLLGFIRYELPIR